MKKTVTVIDVWHADKQTVDEHHIKESLRRVQTRTIFHAPVDGRSQPFQIVCPVETKAAFRRISKAEKRSERRRLWRQRLARAIAIFRRD
jgi:hypothetical protein